MVAPSAHRASEVAKSDMEPWLKDLRRGAVVCRVLHPSTSAAAFRPRRLSQLWRPIRVGDLNQTARGEFAEAYRDFVESGAEQASYDAEACLTKVKFGAPIQFRESFTVAFRRRRDLWGRLLGRRT
ncbi:hypothetical protein [Phenylobacterium aquaticum]|uniref:hypothetical protein n=1 Tax=Phenylobacterium aquaticum TaxID=1763816 RepID=UPI0026EAAB87|nr:hypothetical protein [Phenylobacterium aquaticum]